MKVTENPSISYGLSSHFLTFIEYLIKFDTRAGTASVDFYQKSEVELSVSNRWMALKLYSD